MAVDLVAILNGIRETNVTKTVHKKLYDAVLPTRPELSQAGKTILITGGGTNAGLAISQAFVRASASAVIIVGRRAEVLEDAKTKLEADVKMVGGTTKIIAQTCDIAKISEVDELWKQLADQNVGVDVFVSNAAMFTEAIPMLDQGFDSVWSKMEANVKAPMYLADKFYKQGGDGMKVSHLNLYGSLY
jgi:NAD(P)-dependent dehydrogenase (short-subunit alcohol dehydrogenase family)